MDLVRRYYEYAPKFTQAVAISVLPEDRLRKWAGQSFHDKNYLRSQVKMTKALAVDSRDLHKVLDWRRSNVNVLGDVFGTVVNDDAGKQSVTPRSSRQAIGLSRWRGKRQP